MATPDTLEFPLIRIIVGQMKKVQPQWTPAFIDCSVTALGRIIYGGDNAYDEAGDGDVVLPLQPLAPKLE